jgi:3-hydroxyacyl-CoA dehydrogenase
LLRKTDHPQAKFLWAIYRDAFHYAACHLGSVADTARDLDFALRWGFGWDIGPFEIWQSAGWRQVAEWVRADIESGQTLCTAPLPSWVLDGPVAQAGGVHTPGGSWNPTRAAFEPRIALPVYARQVFRAPVFGETTVAPATAGVTLHEDDACRIWHGDDAQGRDTLVFSIKTKMHAIGPAVGAGLLRAVELAEAGFRGLVIWSPDEPFSAGADLQTLMPIFMSKGAKGIGEAEKQLQDTFLRVKYAQVPVVAAVSGMALGGGCELLLHCARRVAHLESYIGLVEIGVGLIPGAGGLKEGALRAARAAGAAGVTDPLPYLKAWFENAAMAKVSTSAREAQQMGYLQADDHVVFHKHELLFTAIETVRHLSAAGYRPPLANELVPVAGRSACATIRSTLVNMREGGFISAHDEFLAGCIADVLCGGDLEAGTLVDEAWFLAQERRHFEQLVGHPKSQERMMGLLQGGKPVRN